MERDDMPDNGNGSEGERATISYAEARQAVGPPRDRLDLVAQFAGDQCDALRRAIEAQARAMSDLAELLNERFKNIESEILRLKAERQADSGAEDGSGSLQ
jgi:hypothetical protein